MNAVVATLTDGPGAVPGTETATTDPAATAAAVGAPAGHPPDRSEHEAPTVTVPPADTLNRPAEPT